MTRKNIYVRPEDQSLFNEAERLEGNLSQAIAKALTMWIPERRKELEQMQRIIENLLQKHDYCEAYHDGYTYTAAPEPETRGNIIDLRPTKLTVARESLPAHSHEVYANLDELVAQVPSDLIWYPGEGCTCDTCDLLHRLDPEHGGNGYGVYKCNIDVFEHEGRALREALAAVFGADDYLEPGYLVANQPGHLAWEGEACPGDLEEICAELDRRGVDYDLDCDEEEDEMYEIVTPLTASPSSEWTTDGLGASDANEFDSVEEALEGIDALRALGEGFEYATLAVRRVGDDWPLSDTIVPGDHH